MIEALLFDKDGTLFDFQASWGAWAVDLLEDLAGGDAGLAADLAQRIGLDAPAARFHPHSPLIAGTSGDAVAVLLPALPQMTAQGLAQCMLAHAERLRPVEAVPLLPLMARLRGAGLALGVATNDDESAARAQLAAIGAQGAFDLVLGADSGHGPKPGPGMCLAFADALGIDPGRIAMIGDSTHDLRAGRAAGMRVLGVLTGPATRAELAPEAEAVLPDIGHLPAWLGLPG